MRKTNRDSGPRGVYIVVKEDREKISMKNE